LFRADNLPTVSGGAKKIRQNAASTPQQRETIRQTRHQLRHRPETTSRFSVGRASVESAWLGVLHAKAVIVCGSKSWSPAFRRLAFDGWQSQRVNRLKAGLQPRRLALPRHDSAAT